MQSGRSMDRDEALRLLKLEGPITPEDVESAARRRVAELDEQMACGDTGELKEQYDAAREKIERAVAALRSATPGQADALSQPDEPPPVGRERADEEVVLQGYSGGAPIHLPVGRLLARRFELRRRIGLGPMGAVFAALDQESGREVAVKVFLPGVLRDEQAEQHLARQVERAGRTSHPGIVKTYGVHKDGPLYFVAMELLEGASLRQRMDALRATGRRFTVDEVVRLGTGLCEALAHARQHTLHGGIKPENILLCEDGHPKLTDFGVARLLNAGSGGAAAVSMRAAPYLSPEQLRGSKDIDHRADQYATAAVLYDMLTGDVALGRVKAAQQRRADVPRALSRALSRALEADPNDRFADMAAFGAALADRRSSRVKRVALWVGAVVILSVVVGGVTVPRWRDRAGLMVRQVLHDPEAQAAAESARSQALASASEWQSIADLLPDTERANDISDADEVFAEGERRLEAQDYNEAARLFRRAVELYEAQVVAATESFRDEPTRVARTAKALRDRLDELEQQLYDRLAESADHLEKCEEAVGSAQTEADREALADRLRDAEAELQLQERLVSLTRANVLSVPTRRGIADQLDRADQLFEEGRYRAALTAYAEVRAKLEVLLGWPRLAEQALRAQMAATQQIERFRSALGSVGGETVGLQAELENAEASLARGELKLAEGSAEEAAAFFESVRQEVSELRTAAVTELLSRARGLAAEDKPSAAMLALDELLALEPGHVAGRQLRQEILSRRPTNSVNMELIFIPPGEFLMGSPLDEPGRDDDEGQHVVEIPAGYYLSSTEVTQAQWSAVMGNNPSTWQGDDLPVDGISWQDAITFCEELSRVEGRRYRLPTEAEWEYACRAGTTTPFAFGHFISTDRANYDGQYAYGSGPKGEFRNETVPVGSFPPNAWGLYDMHGNVWEWCSDVYEGEAIAVAGAAGEEPVERYALRGGSWRHRPRYCRCANRVWAPADSRIDTVGFRVVLESE